MYNPIKNIYDWVISLSNSKNAKISLGFISYCEAIFFPIPPDVLFIPLCLGKKKNILSFFIICSFCSILGGITGYLIGYSIWWDDFKQFSIIAEAFFLYIPGFSESGFYSLKSQYDLYGFWIIFTAGFTPIPYKIFTISAGAFSISLPIFIIASGISRSLRFLILAILLYKFGENIRDFIERYFNLLAVIFTLILLVGFLLIRIIS